MATDNLGISEKENLQIDALTLGADPIEVASISRQPIDEIPQLVSEYDEAGQQFLNQENSEYLDGPSPLAKPEAARNSLYASLAKDGDVISDYRGMYDQFREIGTSSIYDSIRHEVRRTQTRDFDQLTREVAQEGDVDTTQTLLEARQPMIDDSSNIRKAGLQKTSQSFVEAQGFTPRAIEDQIRFLESLTSEDVLPGGQTSKEKINQIIDRAVADSSLDGGDIAIDFLESTIVGEHPLALSKVGQDILGERYYALGGTMLRDLAQHLRNTPDDQKEAEAQRIVDSVIKHSGAFQDNDVAKVFFLEQFRSFIQTPGGDIPFDRWVADVVGIAEIAGLGALGATGIKLLSKFTKLFGSSSSLLKKSALSEDLQRANPNLDATLTSESIKSADVAEELGTTQAESLMKVMPSALADEAVILDGAPNSVLEKFTAIKTKAEAAQEYVDNTYLFTSEEARQKELKLIDIFQNENDIVKAKPSAFSVKLSDNKNSHIVRATYGDDTDQPLNFVKAFLMRNKIRQTLREEGLDDATANVIVRNKEIGTYEPFDISRHGSKDDYMVSFEMEAKLNTDDILPGQILGEGSTKGVGKVMGRMASYFVSPQNYIDRTLLGAARVANDQKFFRQRELLAIAKPFLRLNYFGKKRVANLLTIGETEQKVFKYSELQGRYSLPEIEAYYSARFLNDSVYNIKNSQMHDKLKADGFKGLSVKLSDEVYFKNGIKVIDKDSVLSEAKIAFDPYTQKAIDLNEEVITELDRQGLVIGKVLKKVDQDDEMFSYVVVKQDDVHELPQKVYPYIEGYNFRINNDPYFIDRASTKVIDGERNLHRSTVGVARSANEAKRYIDKLTAEDSSAQYSMRLDRNINSDDSLLANDIDVLDGSGNQFWFSARGPQLKRLDETLSSVEDPVTALNRMVSSISNVTTHGELLETALIRHRKTYGGLEHKGQKLWTWDQDKKDWHFNKELARPTADPKIAAALAEYEYLETLKYTPTSVDKAWRDLLEGIDGMFGSLGPMSSRISSEVTRTLASVTPGQAVRNAAFSLTIPVRPFRHLVLQSLTGLNLFGIDPLTTVTSLRDTNLIMLSMASWQNPTAWSWMKKAARLFGYSEDEWQEVFDAFRTSGKAYAIDSNVAIGEANFSWARSMPDSVLGEGVRVLGNIAKAPITIGKAVGFDTGELANQALTYMFAFKRWQKANPGKKLDQRAKDEILNKARNYSIDMTKTDAFAYQSGAFASMTQFMAINHKMALKILGQDPDIPGGTALHGKYIAGLLAMYGTAGLGAQDFYDSWIKEQDVEIPPELEDVLYGGFTQALFNKSLDLAFGQERGTTRTALSDSFAPTSGVINFPKDFVTSLLEGNLIEALAGPSANILPNVATAARYAADVWALDDDLNTPEKVIKSYQLALREFGSFSDYYKYNLTVAYNDRMGRIMTVGRDGRPSVEARAWTEIYAKGILGLNTRGEQELYNRYLTMYRDVNSSGKAREAQVDKDAQHLVRYIYETFATTPNPIERQRKTKAIAFALHGGDKLYGLEVHKRAQQLFRMDPQFELFVQDIIKNFSLLDAEADFNSMRNAVRNSDAMKEEDKPILIKSIDALESSSESARRLINENI